ncbi:MAG: hypothetical protein KAR11_06475 [Phycisphaerae bacterium]|nr:hypothetical protein [Phycisphaerae bacterium]
MMTRFRRLLRRLRGIGVSLTGLSLSWGPKELDRELVAELKHALDNPEVEKLIPEALISYYAKNVDKGASLQLFQNKATTFPILKKHEWIADPFRHPTGLHPRLTLTGRESPLAHPELAREYREAISELNYHFVENPIFAASKIGSVGEDGAVPIEVKMSRYADYVFTAEILNAELCLKLVRSGLTESRNAFPLRDNVGILNLDRYVAKIGLNVLTAKYTGSEYQFYVMDRSFMVMRRPLEYPNAIHVVPAGTVQPEGEEFRDNAELSLEMTLVREYAEEFFKSDLNARTHLQQALKAGSSKFLITGLGIDALTHKLEICGLLLLEKESPLGDEQIRSPEGLIKPVSRDELEVIGQQVKTTLPAGAVAIWQGLRYLDVLSPPKYPPNET